MDIVMNNIKKSILLFFILILPFASFGRLREDSGTKQMYGPLAKTTSEVVPDIMVSWVGSGFLTKYTISNTGQNGIFEPPGGWEHYDGMFPSGYGLFNGRTGEFPRGTNQYYVWGAGLWIGARSDNFNTADDRDLEIDASLENVGVIDSLFDESGNFVRTRRAIKNVRVATAAYYSEMGAISKLWQSDQRINGVLDGKDPTKVGEFLFGQKNKNLEDYQEPWSYFFPKPGDYYGKTESDTVFRLDYQGINEKRQVLLDNNEFLDPDLILLDPLRKDQLGNEIGDIISDEDSYAVFGDYIKERDASFLWITGYDIRPLGVRVEQRTYSWRIDDYLYMNYKIKNMNDFPVHDVFVGYFMDNDVGYADDDLIGFDRKLNLGYSYDSDLQETGWQTSAGYMGSVFVETPRKYFPDGTVHDGNDGIDNDFDGYTDEIDEYPQIGLTGFQTWIRSDLGKSEGFAGDVDDDETDHLKYFELALQDSFEVFEEAQDVRQLASSGPFLHLEPGEEISVTIAIVAGASLSELKENTAAAIAKYNTGFIGPEPPPSPDLAIQPGNQTLYLSWQDNAEKAIDPFTGKEDFAGYRVYKSTSGLQGTWELLADYDVDDDSSEYDISIKYKIGQSNLIAEDMGFLSNEYIDDHNYDYETLDGILKEGTYSLEFQTIQIEKDGVFIDTLGIIMYDVDETKIIPYTGSSAVSQGYGFCMFDDWEANHFAGVQPSYPIYVSGQDIFFNGAFIRISDGNYVDLDGNGIITDSEKALQSTSPQPGDVFIVKTFPGADLGDQSGLEYTFVDEDVENGLTYYYSVTSYDKGEPALEIPSLESSFYQNMQAAIPQHIALEYAGEPDLSEVFHAGTGNTTGQILRAITDHGKLTGHRYNFKFFSNNPEDTSNVDANYGILIDESKTLINVSGDFGSGPDSVAWDIDLGKFPIIPGSVTISLTGSESGEFSDADSSGLLTGSLDGVDLTGIINYGTGIIKFSRDTDFPSTINAAATFQHSDVFVRDAYTGKVSGKILLNENRYSLNNLYYPEEESDTPGDTISHGFLFAAYSPTLEIDSVTWGLGTDVDYIYKFTTKKGRLEPYDFIVTFPEEGTASAFQEFKHKLGDTEFTQIVPWKVWNSTLGIQSRSWNSTNPMDPVVPWLTSNSKNKVDVLAESVREDSLISTNSFSINFKAIYEDENLGISDTLNPPTSDDTLYIFTSRPITTNDRFSFTTTNMFTKKEKVNLDDIRVVPNPYYVRAAWDTDRYNQHINFTHLPSPGLDDNGKLQPVNIRIFNLAGNMVAHLKKDGIVEGNETYDSYGTLSWDLRNFESLKVASGLYLYHLEAWIDGEKETQTGKFAIILGP